MTSVADYDYFGLDSQSTKEPHKFFSLAREHAPVYQDPRTGVYILTRYDDVTQVARDSAAFSSIVSERGPLTPFPGAREGQSVPEALAEYRRDHPDSDIPLLTLDPPEHGRMRALCGRLFTPKRMAEKVPRIGDLADSLISDFIDEGRCEWIAEFANPMAFLVICELFGVPYDDQLEFKRLAQQRPRENRPGTPHRSHPEAQEQMRDAQAHQFEYFARHLAERRAEPHDDVMSEYVNNSYRDTGELPEVGDLVGIAGVLFGAGQETTVHMFSSGMRILLDHPEIQKELRDDPSLAPLFIEEVLRYEPPVKALCRLALEDNEVGGVEIPAGSIVLLSWAAANRDPERWTHPDEFDMHREESRAVVSFGFGEHSCPGAPLARLEGQIGFQKILSRTTDLRHATGADPLEYLPSFILRALRDVPVEFDVA